MLLKAVCDDITYECIDFFLFLKRRDFEISCCCVMHCRSKVLWGKNGLSFLIYAFTDAFPLYKICRHGIRNLTEAINSNWIWRCKSRYQERERPWWEHWQLLRAIAATLPSFLSPHWFNQSSCIWIQRDPRWWGWLPRESVYGCQSAKLWDRILTAKINGHRTTVFSRCCASTACLIVVTWKKFKSANVHSYCTLWPKG